MPQANHQPQTLGEFNHALQSLNFDPVTKEQLDAVLSTEPKQRLVQAINLAFRDNGAFDYLKGLFMYCGAQEDTAPFAGQQEPESNDKPERSREGADEYRKKHVYGGSAALFFESDTSRKGDHTIRLEGAPCIGTRKYDWENKIAVQLTQHELLVFTGVLYGMLPGCEYGNHGEDNSKGFSIEDQGEKLFVKVFAKGKKACAVPMTPEDAFFVAQICLGQMKKNAPWLDGGEIMSTLKRVVALRKKSR